MGNSCKLCPKEPQRVSLMMSKHFEAEVLQVLKRNFAESGYEVINISDGLRTSLSEATSGT